jgi:peptidoglycan/LPS O-acetylase OafA/YrhL
MLRLRLVPSRGTVEELFSGRNNGIGLIRLLLALAVVVSHSNPLGFAREDVGHNLAGGQTNLGNMAVYGFFVLSGMLITRSARRTGIARYAWHRALRILPGLWVCLLITALVVAPLVTLREHGSLAGFWSGPQGPLQYLWANWWTGVRQYGIHDLLKPTTPYGRWIGASVFDGALWSLAYEMLAYICVGVLAFSGVLVRARRFVLVSAVGTYLLIWSYYLSGIRHGGHVSGDLKTTTPGFHLPLMGGFVGHWLLLLGFFFMAGAAVDLYRERVPINDGLGVLSIVLLAGSLLFGGFFVIGGPAFAYLLIWASVRLPRQVHWVGRKNDYSYGIYIYGFVGQQVLASLGANKWGYLPFVSISIAVAVVCAFCSWHVVEHNALRLKGWTPRLGWLRPGTAGAGSIIRPRQHHEHLEPSPAEANQSDGDADAAAQADARSDQQAPDGQAQPLLPTTQG